MKVFPRNAVALPTFAHAELGTFLDLLLKSLSWGEKNNALGLSQLLLALCSWASHLSLCRTSGETMAHGPRAGVAPLLEHCSFGEQECDGFSPKLMCFAAEKPVPAAERISKQCGLCRASASSLATFMTAVLPHLIEFGQDRSPSVDFLQER